VKLFKKRMFETTLIDGLDFLFDLHNNDKYMEKFVTVRCAIYDPERGNCIVVKNKVIKVNERPDFGNIRNDWKDFSCAAKGDLASNPMRHFTTLRYGLEGRESQVENRTTPPMKEVVFVNPAQVLQMEKWKEVAMGELAPGFNPPPVETKCEFHTITVFVRKADLCLSPPASETLLGPLFRIRRP
jgi:hypothetical protein